MNMHTEAKTFIADILIVDDKLENIRFLSEFLSKQQYQVRKAINGQAALTAVESIPPDLILLDVNMPGMGGYKVSEKLKSNQKTSSIPIIFLSAGDDINDKARAFQSGGIDYITKPFQLEEILVRIQTQLTIQTLQKELKTRNEQLQSTVLALQKAQNQLIQKEKLVSAGRITAGISHEINNPLSFIKDNLDRASDYNQKLISLIHIYQKAFPSTTPEIRDFVEEIDLEFLTSDFEKTIHSINTGAERIHAIVRALHIFSRLDESDIKLINVHESIESVLTILRHQLTLSNGSVTITIHKRFEEIPLLLGHENLFNQSFLNLLQNAIDALNLRMNLVVDNSFKPTIWINTHIVSQGKIRISIQDNGVGVSQEHQPHLFEPFFTTKPGGQGLGLGLFTSHQIITELHQGHLTYQASPEGGSEFVIEVPLPLSP